MEKYCEHKHVCWAHNHSLKIAFVICGLQSLGKMFGRILVLFLQFFLLCLLSYIGQISNFLSWWEQIFWFSDNIWNGLHLCFGRKSVLSAAVVLKLISLMPLTPVNQEQFYYSQGSYSHLVLLEINLESSLKSLQASLWWLKHLLYFKNDNKSN